MTIPLDSYPDSSLRRPRLRPSVVVQRSEHRMRFLSFADLKEVEFEVRPYVHDLIRHLDGETSCEELLGILRRDHGEGVSEEEMLDVVRCLAQHGLLVRGTGLEEAEPFLVRQAQFLAELAASRPELPADVGILQRRLSGAEVLVLGAGGTGSWVVRALCASGIGTVTVLDPDEVELSNLNRQALYLREDIGSPKVEALARRCAEFAPATRIRAVRRRVGTAADLVAHLGRAEMVVSCADEPSVNAVSDLVADACEPRGIPHIVGGAYGGHLGIPGTTVLPGRSVCWKCLRHEAERERVGSGYEDVLGRTGSAGSIGVITALVANITAWDVIRVLVGMPPALADQVRELDVISMDWRSNALTSRPDCPCRPA
jgi:molybdopterin/thiamine biosynthesis adenylyltransferase